MVKSSTVHRALGGQVRVVAATLAALAAVRDGLRPDPATEGLRWLDSLPPAAVLSQRLQRLGPDIALQLRRKLSERGKS